MTTYSAAQHPANLPCGPTAARDSAAAERCGEYVRSLRSAALGHGIARATRGLAAWLLAPAVGRARGWSRNVGQRAELAGLDDRMLADIGLSRDDARRLTGHDPQAERTRAGGGAYGWRHDVHLDR